MPIKRRRRVAPADRAYNRSRPRFVKRRKRIPKKKPRIIKREKVDD